MNKLLCLNIDRAANNRIHHKVEYCIYTSITDVEKNNDPALREFLLAIGWNEDEFKYPIVRIYNILDEEGKPINESDIKADMDTLILFIDNQFKEIDYPDKPIYFTSVLDLFYSKGLENIGSNYKSALAYECMQFELAGFFNIRSMVKSRFVSFVYANESAQKIYFKLINPEI